MQRLPQFAPKSVLDLGASRNGDVGCHASISSVGKNSLVEHDKQLIAIGKKLASETTNDADSHASWQEGDLHQINAFDLMT